MFSRAVQCSFNFQVINQWFTVYCLLFTAHMTKTVFIIMCVYMSGRIVHRIIKEPTFPQCLNHTHQIYFKYNCPIHYLFIYVDQLISSGHEVFLQKGYLPLEKSVLIFLGNVVIFITPSVDTPTEIDADCTLEIDLEKCIKYIQKAGVL